MTRYIIRDPNGSEKYDNSIPYKWKLFDNIRISTELIKVLLKYRDEIDYNSLLVFIDTTQREHEYDVRIRKDKNNSNRYYVVEQFNRCYSTITSYIALLFNKYNECKIIDMSSISLSDIHNIIIHSDVRYSIKYSNDVSIFNLGEFAFMIDYNYSPVHKTPFCYYKHGNVMYYINNYARKGFPEELNLFVSKTQPNIKNCPGDIEWLIYNHKFKNSFHNVVKQYIDEHIETILADVGIPTSQPPSVDIKYISCKECKVKNIEQRHAELLNELKKLNLEMMKQKNEEKSKSISWGNGSPWGNGSSWGNEFPWGNGSPWRNSSSLRNEETNKKDKNEKMDDVDRESKVTKRIKESNNK